MYLPRFIDNELLTWKNETGRKPLLLRGARQVGKSSAVRNLSKHFTYFIELNFDENPGLSKLFDNNQSVEDVCELISIYSKTPVVAGETLLFFDEIQSCIPAISMLRYFYEKKPDLHVIAAGSLLEFAMMKIPSYAVGRVRSMFLFPFSFSEFLNALGEDVLVKLIEKSDLKKPINELIHQKIIHYLRRFLIIGGMPEAVSVYKETGDLLKVQNILNDLIISFQEDFSKYKKKIRTASITEVLYAVIQQVGNKFTYSYPNSTQNNNQVKEILALLQKAGLIIPVTHTSANGIPLGAETNPKKRKFLVLDTGIYQRALGLDLTRLFNEDPSGFANRGSIAELHAGLEIVKNSTCYSKPELYYWQRDARNSQAEVDYIVQKQDEIIPIEIKAGTKGAMQSLYIFLKEKNIKKGIRCSLENFSEYESIEVIPLYAVGNIFKA